MEPKIFCQNCTMPIDNVADRGTEKDGSRSNEYCKYCYENGSFIEPNMTFEEMKSEVITQMEKMKLSPELIRKSVDSLARLKRWQGIHV